MLITPTMPQNARNISKAILYRKVILNATTGQIGALGGLLVT